MGKLATSAALTVVGLFGGLLLALLYLPAGPLLAAAGPGLELAATADATLAEGRALVTSTQGTDVVRWRWCPGEGLMSFCVQSSGHSGFLQGVVAISPVAVTIPRMTFEAVDPGLLGIGGWVTGASLGGELAGYRLSWAERCPHRGLLDARGHLVLGGGPGAGEIDFEGDGKGILLAGSAVSGRLEARGEQLAGTLNLAPDTGRAPVAVQVAKRLPCR